MKAQLSDQVEQVLEEIRKMLARVDADGVRERALKASTEARGRARRRLRPQPQRMALKVSFALGALIGVSAAVGYLLADAGRRRRISSGVRQLREDARERGTGIGAAVDGLMAKARGKGVSLTEASLEAEVDSALAAAGGAPAGLERQVEGRTVYLRGTVADPLKLDQLMQNIQALPGVVAVVNLTVPVEALT